MKEIERQLFVRNLPYDITEEDLTEVFQDFGPIKNVSVAKGADGKSKGFGFVKFSLEEDAKSALDTLQGKEFNGRIMKIEFGTKKERDDKKNKNLKVTTYSAKQSETPKQSISEAKMNSDIKIEDNTEPNSSIVIKKSRQLIVFGVPIDVNKKIFKNAINKISKKSVVELIKEDHELGENLQIIHPLGKIMMITSPSKKDAGNIINLLDSATIRSLGLALPDENGQISSSKKDRILVRSVADIAPLELIKKKCRLILRNLSFQANEQNIIDKMSKFGPIVDVDIPRDVVEKKPKKEKDSAPNQDARKVLHSKGFAFVTYLCEKDARSAVEASNGLKICNREIAVDYCMSKGTFLKYGKDDEEDEVEAVDEISKPDSTDMDVDETDSDNSLQRESSKDLDEGPESNDIEVKSDSSKDTEDENEDESDDEEISNTSNDNVDDQSLPSKKATEDVNEGKTVFVRGLPFDATDSDVANAFKQYGKISLAIVVKDKNTGISKGTAFVKFQKKTDLDKCIEDCNGKIVVKDRFCRVDIAVDRDSAQKLKNTPRQSKDKRNIYLANEGLIVENNKDANYASMSDIDKEKRQRAQREKNKKLQNPLFFVSATRLSIRNLSKSISDNELKVECLKSTKQGLLRKLVSEKDIENQWLAQGNKFQLSKEGIPSFKVPAFNHKSAVSKAKIMFDPNKLREGKPQSRGYAFVDFENHGCALACLREMNNNPKYNHIASNEGGRLIVEFCLENIEKLKIKESRNKNNIKPKKEIPKESTNSDKPNSAAKFSKGQQPLMDHKKESKKRPHQSVNSPGELESKRAKKESTNKKISQSKLDNKKAQRSLNKKKKSKFNTL